MANPHWLYSVYLALSAANGPYNLKLTSEQAMDAITRLLPNVAPNLLADIVANRGTVSDRFASKLAEVDALVAAEIEAESETSLNSQIRAALAASREREMAPRAELFTRKPTDAGDEAAERGQMNDLIRGKVATRGRVPEGMRRG